MVIRKWNENKKDYDVVKIPDSWNVPLHCKNMDEIVNCVNCGCKMKCGDGFTSKRYHNIKGMAYSECRKCFDEYLPTYFKSRRSKDEAKSDAKAINAELEPIVREFMLKVSEVAIKHDRKVASLIRSAACIVIHESDVVESKVERLQKLLSDKKFDDILSLLEDATGDEK